MLPVFAEAEPLFSNQFREIVGWQQAEELSVAEDQTGLRAKGQGAILYNGDDWENAPYLVTKENFQDCIIKIDFMLAKGSRAGLYVQGRYGINIADNYRQHELNYYDMGGLGQRWDESREPKGFDGVAPSANATKAPGEWQKMEVKFRAPRFNDAGQKVDDAFFLEVRVNGEVVQRNTLARGFTRGSLFAWEQGSGAVVLQADGGPIAIRNFDARRADFSQIEVPEAHGQRTNEGELTDFVALGKKHFVSFGCGECHTTRKNDAAVKSGPGLFGLFTHLPRDREIVESGENHQFIIKADTNYLHRSVRQPHSQLAVAETGEQKGKPFVPVMPAYSSQIITDGQIDAIGFYLATLNEREAQGPVVKLIADQGPQQYDPLADRLQFLVGDRTRIQRGPIAGMSSRSIHIGLPGGINYSFDPRILSIVKIWQGGFLDMSGELQNRGGGGLKLGYNSQNIDFGASEFLLAPLNADGDVIDFSFKEAKFGDTERIQQSLYALEDHLETLEAVNAQFLGYSLDSKKNNANPEFHYRIGENHIFARTEIGNDGKAGISVTGEFATTQSFAINTKVLGHPIVNQGAIKNGVWTIPAGKHTNARLDAEIALSSSPWSAGKSKFDHDVQAVEYKPAKASLPAGYSVRSIMPPKDNFGRDQLFEALGVDVADDGTIVVSTRTAGIWRIVEGKWYLFAEGIFDSLGVVVEDEKGLVLTVGQKAELTRIADTNGDGRADQFKTLFDAFSYHGNYHTYMHGPVKTDEGKYFVALNLAHDDNAYKAGGQYMGTLGGYSGWGFMVSDDGTYTPWVNGLRSPAGLGIGPDGRLWYADNQGEYMGTSKLFPIKQGGFYGHPSALVDLPGMTPDSDEITWRKFKDRRIPPAVLFPHNRLANSPGHLVWDLTEGRFGPFSRQIFIGDQTQSNLFRVIVQQVDDVEQGVVIPFATGLESGVMRPVFLNDGSLIVGQTGRGWQAKVGNVASLQTISWDGKTMPAEITNVLATPEGFEVVLTVPAKKQGALDARIASWVYRDAPDYGSPELDEREEDIRQVSLSDDGKSVYLALDELNHKPVHPDQTARVYHIQLNRKALFAEESDRSLDAFYTLYRWPRRQ